MAILSIKNVPERLHKALKAASKQEARSLNSFVIVTLGQAIGERQRLARLKAARRELDLLVARQPYTGETSLEILREDRARDRA